MGKNFRKEFWKPILLQQDLNCKLFSPLNFLLKYVFQNIFVLQKESKQSLFFLHETGWKNIVWVKKTLQFHFQVSNIKKKCRNLERLSWCNSPTTVSHTQKNNDKLISGWCLFFLKEEKISPSSVKTGERKRKEPTSEWCVVFYFSHRLPWQTNESVQFEPIRSDLLMINKNHLSKLFSLHFWNHKQERKHLRSDDDQTLRHLSFRASVAFETFTKSYLYFVEFIIIELKRWRVTLDSVFFRSIHMKRWLWPTEGAASCRRESTALDWRFVWSDWTLQLYLTAGDQLNLSPKSNTHVRKKDRKQFM